MTQVPSISTIQISDKQLLSLAMCYSDEQSLEQNAKIFVKTLSEFDQFSAVYLWIELTGKHLFEASNKITPSIEKLKKKAPNLLKGNDFISFNETYKSKNYFGIPLGKLGIIIIEIDQKDVISISEKFINITKKFKNYLSNQNKKIENQFLNDQIEAIVNNNVYGICLLKNYIIIEANDSLARITGYSKDELAGMHLENLLIASEKEKASQLKSAFENRKIDRYQLNSKFISAEGKVRNFSASLQGIYKEDNQLIATVCTLVDTTEAINNKEALNHSRNLFKDIFNTIDTAIISIEGDKIKDASPSFFRLVERKKTDNIVLEEFLTPKDYKNLYSIYYEILNGRVKHGSTTMKISTDAGKEKYVLAKLSHKASTDGSIPGVLITLADISDLKEKEREKEKSEALLRSIIDTSKDQIMVVNEENKLILANEPARTIFKDAFNIDLKIGQHVFIGMEKVEKIGSVVDKVIKSGKSQALTIHHETKNGTQYNNIIISQIADKAGKIIGGMCIGRDISKSVIQTKNIIEREAMLKAVLDATPDGIYAIDKDLNFLTINKKAQQDFKQHLNINIEEKMNLKDVATPEQIKKWREQYYDKVFAGEEFVFKGTIPGQEKALYENRYSPVVNQMGEIIGALEISRDLSELMKKEDELSKKENQYRSIVESSPTGIAKIDNKGLFTFVSAKTEEILESNSLLGKNYNDFIREEYQDTLKTHINNLKKGGDYFDFQISIITQNGNKKYLDGVIRMTNDNGELLIIFNDVTNRILAQKKLITTQQSYTAMYENMHDAILIYKFSEDKFIDCNSSAQELFGYSKKELLSKSRENLIPQLINEINFTKLHQRIKDKSDKFINGEKIYSIKLNTVDESKNVTADLNLIVENNNPDELFIIAHDKTSEIAAREELQSKNDQLVKYIDSNLQLENFAYIASHDLKAPLRTVSSFAYLLKQKSYSLLDEKSKGYLDIVVKSSGNMQLLIDDLLRFSRVGTQKVKLKTLNLDDILQRILIELNTNIKEAKAKIEVGDLPSSIIADESMMIQIFQNLIGNAIKFRRENITPIINVTSEDKGNFWEFAIADNGIGIKKENYSKIFGTFEKLHSNDVFEGTGLGLSICQKISQNHGGNIWVEANENNGSTFKFTISKKIELIEGKILNS